MYIGWCVRPILFTAKAPGCKETSSTRYNPACTSQTWVQKHAPSDTHTFTRAPWQIITPTASREQNAHVGPITALDKGHGTPKTLLLCLSPRPCVCFAWVNELDLRIFTAFCSTRIPVVWGNQAMEMRYLKLALLRFIAAFYKCIWLFFLRWNFFSSSGKFIPPESTFTLKKSRCKEAIMV